MRFLLSRLGITKMVLAILIIVFASSVVATGYYITTHLISPNASPTPTPSSEPTVTPTPTPMTITTPTPTGSVFPTPTSTPNPTELVTPDKVRDAIMSFIRSNHPETAQFIKDLIWTGGRVTPSKIVGAETYMYYSQGWNVTISFPVIPDAIYNIIADYSAPSIGIPYRIIWKGNWQNEVINETSYVFAQ